ncbi:PAS domain-containing sensor histidine kinase [Flaviaesturariibacter amylovorans]|uniref:histidine kinase n=2 Tax=Flaviaesturariibacter amylovorans TaxID=1084520 RepID=A0ABP8HSU9_9BACT
MDSFINEKEHQLLLDAIREHAIFMMDTEGNINSWNEGARRLKGFEEEEVMGRHFRMLFRPEDLADGRPEREIRKALETGKYEEEWWRLRKDGSRFWAHVILHPIFDDHGTHIGFAKITSDISRYKQTNELNRFLMNEVTGFAIFLLDPNGKIAQWSKAAESIMGFTEAEALGRSLSLLYVPREDNALETDVLRHLEQASSGRYEEESWKVRKDGSQFWANYIITPLHNGDGDGYVVMIQDLTERRAYEQEQKTSRLLAASNKQLERFAFVASHDLKEPVRKISVFCHMLRAETPQQEALINKILAGCKRTVALLENILELSQVKEELPSEKKDLDRILDEVLNFFAESIQEKKVHIQRTPLPPAPVIAAQFEQLLINLLGNALKFARTDGVTPTITMSGTIVAKEGLGPGLRNAIVHRDQYLQLQVCDNGIGFGQEQSQNIFELFIRLHGSEAYEGNGIGLSICKRIAENHGGHIDAFAEAGRGACFVVTLPYSSGTEK